MSQAPKWIGTAQDIAKRPNFSLEQTFGWNQDWRKQGIQAVFKLPDDYQKSALLFKLRLLKKQGNLYKHGSDKIGNIWIKAKERDLKKRVIQHYRQGEIYPTVTKDELMKLLGNNQ